MHREIRSVDLDVRFALFQHRVGGHAARELNLNLLAAQGGDVRLAALFEAQNVGVVQLNFGTRLVGGGNTVPSNDGSVERCGRPVARVSALRGNIATCETDARHTRVGLRRFRLRLRTGCARHQDQQSGESCYQSEFHTMTSALAGELRAW